MKQVTVYAAEEEAGLGDVLRASGKIAYAAAAELVEKGHAPRLKKKASRALEGRVKAAEGGQPDLHYLQSLLVSTVWNDNDDVFEREEVWAARHTPEDKPFNFEHACDDIIGHMTGCWAAGDDRVPVPDDAPLDRVPSPFHIVTSAVLYKCWEDPALQERMDRVLAEIPEGKWFVSMEALFTGFDYALAQASGGHKVLARSEKTAFLTKHLRSYGGSGRFEGSRVGRVLRNITFSGKGLVRRPANPASVIFPGPAEKQEKPRAGAAVGYAVPTTTPEGDDVTDTEKVAQLEAARKGLEEQVASLSARLQEGESARAKAQAERAQALESQAAALQEKLAAAEAAGALWKAKAEEAEQARARAEKALEDARLEQRTAARTSALKAALGCDDQEAALAAGKLAGLDDESFKAHAEYLAQKAAEFKKAQLPPKETDKPAPMAGFPKAVKTLAGALEGASADVDPPLNPPAPPPDERVEKARAGIVSWFNRLNKIDAQE